MHRSVLEAKAKSRVEKCRKTGSDASVPAKGTRIRLRVFAQEDPGCARVFRFVAGHQGMRIEQPLDHVREGFCAVDHQKGPFFGSKAGVKERFQQIFGFRHGIAMQIEGGLGFEPLWSGSIHFRELST